MAKAAGFTPSTIHRIDLESLQPPAPLHRNLQAVPTTPLFVETLRDIVGLYLSPPKRALVLCIDEKSKIQALDRTHPCCRCALDSPSPKLVNSANPSSEPWSVPGMILIEDSPYHSRARELKPL